MTLGLSVSLCNCLSYVHFDLSLPSYLASLLSKPLAGSLRLYSERIAFLRLSVIVYDKSSTLYFFFLKFKVYSDRFTFTSSVQKIDEEEMFGQRMTSTILSLYISIHKHLYIFVRTQIVSFLPVSPYPHFDSVSVSVSLLLFFLFLI